MPTSLHRYDEPGHVHFLTVSCHRRLPFFGTPDIRDAVADSMRRSRGRLGFRWIGFVIMPEHVHWLVLPQRSDDSDVIPISGVLQSLKTSVGMNVKRALRGVWGRRRSLGHPGLDRWATAHTDHKPIWTTRGIDFNVTNISTLRAKLDYCHANPVTRGLVDRPEDWRWSSYRFYELDDRSSLVMDWDGGDSLF